MGLREERRRRAEKKLAELAAKADAAIRETAARLAGKQPALKIKNEAFEAARAGVPPQEMHFMTAAFGAAWARKDAPKAAEQVTA